MVVTGYEGYGGYPRKTEIWPQPKTQCALTDYPLEVSDAVGFMTALGPAVCGGPEIKRCFVYQQHQWIPFTNLKTPRYGASAIEVSRHQTLIIGGEDENWDDLKSTELITSSGSEDGKDFPVTITGHCTFKINSTHGLVTGGVQDGDYRSANTWFVELPTTTFTEGPTMRRGRERHGCATFHLGSKIYGIASGGEDLDSTEIIDLAQNSPTWTKGMLEKS